jgi:peptide-methionine (S)-S-oxide reductase
MAIHPYFSALRVEPSAFPDPEVDLPAEDKAKATAVLAGGCFWCTEAVFKEVEGVLAVRSGYAGGSAETADYRSVCSGSTGHAEAIEIAYDPRRVSYGRLLKLFFSVAHDPTQVNLQGNDFGPQYRSAIFHASEAERSVAEAYVRQLERAGVFSEPIATTLEPLAGFYEAEDYHQDYAAKNPLQPYVVQAANPKVAKLRKHFRDALKRGAR